MILFDLLKVVRTSFTPIELYCDDCTFIDEGYILDIKKKYGNDRAFLDREIADVTINCESEALMITLKCD